MVEYRHNKNWNVYHYTGTPNDIKSEMEQISNDLKRDLEIVDVQISTTHDYSHSVTIFYNILETKKLNTIIKDE